MVQSRNGGFRSMSECILTDFTEALFEGTPFPLGVSADGAFCSFTFFVPLWIRVTFHFGRLVTFGVGCGIPGTTKSRDSSSFKLQCTHKPGRIPFVPCESRTQL